MDYSRYTGGEEPTITSLVEELRKLIEIGHSQNTEQLDKLDSCLAASKTLGFISYAPTPPNGVTQAGSAGSGLGLDNTKTAVDVKPSPNVQLLQLINTLKNQQNERQSQISAIDFLHLNLRHQLEA